MEAILFYMVDRGATPPVPLVVSAPEVAAFIPGNAVMHAETIGERGERAILLVVHHIALLFHGSEIPASSSVMLIFAPGCVKGGSIVGSRAQCNIESTIPIRADGIGFMIISTKPKIGA